MFLRRVIQRNTFSKFIRTFSQVPGSEATGAHPSAQTINPETPNANETEKKASKDEQLKFINEYKEALHFYQQGKYRISNEFFNRVLNQIEASGQKGSDNHIHILKK